VSCARIFSAAGRKLSGREEMSAALVFALRGLMPVSSSSSFSLFYEVRHLLKNPRRDVATAPLDAPRIFSHAGPIPENRRFQNGMLLRKNAKTDAAFHR